MENGKVCEGVVRFVLDRDGYAIASTNGNCNSVPSGTDVIFRLYQWGGRNRPLKGQMVILEGVEKRSKGWFALKARPKTVHDEPKR